MIDNNKAKQVFKKYVEPYDRENPRIALKIAHTYRVSEIAKKISEQLNLTKEQIELAELIGLLHDIGRFEQIRIYDTFSDIKSIDHGHLGVQILSKNRFLYEFCEDEKYHNIILKAVENHNKFKIADNLSEEELLQAKIVRDADKVDILNLIRFETFETMCKKKDISKEEISKVILDAFYQGKQVDRKENKTNMDDFISDIGIIFDINFKPSFKIIKDNEYINAITNKVKSEEMEKVRDFANKYIEMQLAKTL